MADRVRQRGRRGLEPELAPVDLAALTSVLLSPRSPVLASDRAMDQAATGVSPWKTLPDGAQVGSGPSRGHACPRWSRPVCDRPGIGGPSPADQGETVAGPASVEVRSREHPEDAGAHQADRPEHDRQESMHPRSSRPNRASPPAVPARANRSDTRRRARPSTSSARARVARPAPGAVRRWKARKYAHVDEPDDEQGGQGERERRSKAVQDEHRRQHGKACGEQPARPRRVASGGMASAPTTAPRPWAVVSKAVADAMPGSAAESADAPSPARGL